MALFVFRRPSSVLRHNQLETVGMRQQIGELQDALALLGTPATLLRSARPNPRSPSDAACTIISSGCDAPRRKEKFDVTANST